MRSAVFTSKPAASTNTRVASLGEGGNLTEGTKRPKEKVTTSKRRSARLASKKPTDSEREGQNYISQKLSCQRNDATSQLPDVTRSGSIPSGGAAEIIDFDDYRALRHRYLEPRVRENAELGGGMRLRRQTVPAIIDQDRPGFRRLKRRVSSLENRNEHAEIYCLLRQLRDWEIHPGMMPRPMLEDGDNVGANEVVEMIDLSKHEENENDLIDVDKYIVDVLLVKVKEEPGAIDTTQASGSTVQPTPDAVISLPVSQIGTGSNVDGSEASGKLSKETEISDSGTKRRPNSPDIFNREVIDVDAEDASVASGKQNKCKSSLKWTRDEDDNLCRAVASFAGNIDWSKIASAFPGQRTGLQCLQRYDRLNPARCEVSGKEGGRVMSVETRSRARKSVFTLSSENPYGKYKGFNNAEENTPLRQFEKEANLTREDASIPAVLSASIVTPDSDCNISRRKSTSLVASSASHRPIRPSRKCTRKEYPFPPYDSCGEEIETADRSSTISQLSSVKCGNESSEEWIPLSDESISSVSERGYDGSKDLDTQDFVLENDGNIAGGEKHKLQSSRDCAGIVEAAETTIRRRHKRWTDEEDRLLREAIDLNPDMNWNNIASRVPGRDSSRCRERWYNQLDPDTNRGKWTSSEDMAILRMQDEIGNKWSNIATELGTCRTGDLVKQRAHHLLTKKRHLEKVEGQERHLEKVEGQDNSVVTPHNSDRKRKRASSLQTKEHSKRNRTTTAMSTHSGTLTLASTLWCNETTAATTGDFRFMSSNSIFRHDYLGSWKCRHGRSRTRLEICPRCMNIGKTRCMLGITIMRGGSREYSPTSIFPQQHRCCCMHRVHRLSSDFSAGGKSRQSDALSALLASRGWLPYADTSHLKSLSVRATINPSARICLSYERRDESHEELSYAWREQLRGRKKGQWRPTGSWKAPKWACRQLAPSPPSLVTLHPSNAINHVKIQEDYPETSTSASDARSSKSAASSPLVGRKIAIRIADILTANFLPSIGRDDNSTGTIISSLDDVRYPVYQAPTDELLTRAHSALHTLLPEGDCDCIDVVRTARQYYDHWRPEPGKTRVILLAESHAFTNKDRMLTTHLSPSILAKYKGPRNFVSLVYSLAYGENEALVTSNAIDEATQEDFFNNNKGTPQFWSLLAACSRGTEAVPPIPNTAKTFKHSFAADVLKGGGLKVEDRLEAKVAILEDLRQRGIWLLDASVIGWYISQPQKYRRSRVTNEVHRVTKERPPKSLKAPSLILSWEMYTKHVIRAVAEEGSLRLVIPIGKEVESSLTRRRLEEAVVPVMNQSQVPSIARVTESFPAPNAWIPGGYGPFFTELARVVDEVAPAPKVDLV